MGVPDANFAEQHGTAPCPGVSPVTVGYRDRRNPPKCGTVKAIRPRSPE
jgi:hypothetical protein